MEAICAMMEHDFLGSDSAVDPNTRFTLTPRGKYYDRDQERRRVAVRRDFERYYESCAEEPTDPDHRIGLRRLAVVAIVTCYLLAAYGFYRGLAEVLTWIWE